MSKHTKPAKPAKPPKPTKAERTILKLILRAFGSLNDPRVIGRTKYTLTLILVIVCVGILSGKKTWKAIRAHAVANQASIERMVGREVPEMPVKSTIARAFRKIVSGGIVAAIAKLNVELLRASHNRPCGRRPKGSLPDGIHADGKNIKGAREPGETQSKVHIVSAELFGVSIFSKKIPDKNNEISTFPELIDALNGLGHLKGKVVTIDAMGRQRSPTLKIAEIEAFYAFRLKRNQGKTYDEVDGLVRLAPEMYPGEITVETHQSEEERVNGHLEFKKISLVRWSRGSCRSGPPPATGGPTSRPWA